MATIERIVNRPDGKIGVWTSPKTEIEFNDLGHVQAWVSSPSTDLDEAATKTLLAGIISGAKSATDVATQKSVSIDAKKPITDAVSAAFPKTATK